MAHGGDVVEGLQRHDQAGEGGLLHRAVAVGDGACLACHALHRMQHDEARAAGPELGLGCELDREDQAPLILRHDLSPEVEHAVGGVDAPVVANAKAAVRFLDLQVGDLRRTGLPASAAHDEGEAAQRLGAAVADPAQLAGLERGRERAGGEGPRFRRLLLGTVELERLARCRGHVPSLPRSGSARYSSARSPQHRAGALRRRLPPTGRSRPSAPAHRAPASS